jgi:hypothetical protein
MRSDLGVCVEVMGRYSNPDNVARLNRILTGQGRDRPSHRPVPSLRQKQTRLADSDRTEVVERYQAGETANGLAEAFDVNRATVFAILQRAGIKSRFRTLTDRDIASASAMYEAGQSLASIANHFDVADRTVLNAFRRAGVATRQRGRTSGANLLHRQRQDDIRDLPRIELGPIVAALAIDDDYPVIRSVVSGRVVAPGVVVHTGSVPSSPQSKPDQTFLPPRFERFVAGSPTEVPSGPGGSPRAPRLAGTPLRLRVSASAWDLEPCSRAQQC